MCFFMRVFNERTCKRPSFEHLYADTEHASFEILYSGQQVILQSIHPHKSSFISSAVHRSFSKFKTLPLCTQEQ